MQQMKRWTIPAVLAAALLVGYGATAGADDEKVPTIKEIMKKAHKMRTGLVAVIGQQLRLAHPDWDKIGDESKTLVELGTALGKNKPPRGTAESWETLTKKYGDGTQTLATAAADKDKAKAAKAWRGLTQSCASCHRAHRKR